MRARKLWRQISIQKTGRKPQRKDTDGDTIPEISIQKTGRKPQRLRFKRFNLSQISIQKTGRKPQRCSRTSCAISIQISIQKTGRKPQPAVDGGTRRTARLAFRRPAANRSLIKVSIRRRPQTAACVSVQD